jgi:outer membrane lipopolysaccharide assembly protein LptE/RlpB
MNIKVIKLTLLSDLSYWKRLGLVYGATFCVLTGCGFSLKTENIMYENFPTLMITAGAANNSADVLIKKLKGLNIQTADFNKDLESSLPWLKLGEESFQSYPITVNSSARAAQYELELGFDINLSLNENELIPLERFTVSRDFLENVQNINGSQDEINLMLDEMRNDLSSVVIRRLEGALRKTNLK